MSIRWNEADPVLDELQDVVVWKAFCNNHEILKRAEEVMKILARVDKSTHVRIKDGYLEVLAIKGGNP